MWETQPEEMTAEDAVEVWEKKTRSGLWIDNRTLDIGDGQVIALRTHWPHWA